MKKRILNARKTFVAGLMVVALVGLSFAVFQFRRVQAYDNMLDVANKCMNDEEYGDAIALFQQSLDYKKSPSVEEKIKKAKEMKLQKKNMDEAMKMMNDKKFIEAIAAFEKISKDDNEIYEKAQKNIDECKSQIIKSNVERAQEAADNKDLPKIKECVDEILRLDANNKQALKLKEQYFRDTKKATNNKTTAIPKNKGN